MKITFAFPILFLTTALAVEVPTKKYYHGDKVFRVRPSTIEQLKWLKELRDVHDFWKDPSILNAPVDIHVSKASLSQFLEEIRKIGMNATVNVHDLQKLIDQTEAVTLSRKRREARLGKSGDKIVGTFPRYNEIVSWVSSLCSTHATIATCGSVGTSYEKRDIPYVKVSTGGSQTKQVIVIEGGLHAREWLAIATGIYILDRMVTTYETDPVAKRLLDTYDWIFVPLVNADGYEFSRTDRMWRKTRSHHRKGNCYGVDPNRNYDAWWGTVDSSKSPCSEIYCGPEPFSEPETKAMSVFLNERRNQTLAFFTLHTFGQMWLVPYGDTYDHECPDFSELLRVGKIGTKALMAVNKQRWEVGNTADVLGAASGGGDDWAKLIGIKYSYTLELRPTHAALEGFVVPETYIEPSGKEVWAGITAAVSAMSP